VTRPAARLYRARRRSAQRAAGGAGFTLIELVISLVAGLMVAMAVMGVSKEATTTFHEEVRVAGAEMGLRIAAERLRLDLQRASFMVTGNIAADPLIARAASSTSNLSTITAPVPYSMTYLSGVHIYPSGAYVLGDATYGPELTAQGLSPDAIDLGANFSSSDEYVGAVTWTPAAAPAGCSTAAAIVLQMNTPAGWRIQNAETAAQNAGLAAGKAMLALFHPGTSTTSQFALRLTDASGRYQYVLGCPGSAAVSYNGAVTPPVATIYISANSTILSTVQTGGLGGVSGLGVGWVVASPVEVVHWDVQTIDQLLTGQAPAGTAPVGQTYAYNVTGSGSATTYDHDEFVLTRSYLDFSTCSATSCAADTTTTEVIAEYAVDLKFGITVDTGTPCAAIPCAIAAPSYTTNPFTYYPIDGPTSLSTLGTTTAVTWPGTAGAGPQRIRDMQFRVATRSPFGDRPGTLPGVGTYKYRYQLTPGNALHANAAYPFARVRELASEVTLPNQARFYW